MPNFGWWLFAVIAKPLLVMLRWIHGFVGNCGWSIIILTILINMVLFPLESEAAALDAEDAEAWRRS